MDSRLWLTLTGIILCSSGVFSYPMPESPENSTRGAANETDEDRRSPLKMRNPIYPEAVEYMSKTKDFEHTITIVQDRVIGIGGCPAPDSKDEDPKDKQDTESALTACETEAYRSIVEKVVGMLVLARMEASAVDPGIMLSCALNKGKVELRLAIRFKSKACLTNCKKEEESKRKEKPLKDLPKIFIEVIREKNLQWQITEAGKLDAGSFMNAIGGCNICQQQPSACPPACGCPQTYTAQECPANVPQQCCNQQPAAAAPGQGEVQMQQIVVAPAPPQPISQASQPVPAPCGGGACIAGIPVVQANICAPHCPSMCAPSCLPSCCNGGAGKRMLPFTG